jgi:DNA-directed RNA polymerase specialized sigma24 family protein
MVACPRSEILPLPLLTRLQRLALRRARTPADAADAVQQLMIDVWLRGSSWHEGRIVLQLRSILRNQERSHAARVRREAEYVLMTCGPEDVP